MLKSQLLIYLGNMTLQIALDGTIVTDLMKKGRPWKNAMMKARRHVIDYYVAYNYYLNMNWDGTTTGQSPSLTAAQFVTLMGKIKKYAA